MEYLSMVHKGLNSWWRHLVSVIITLSVWQFHGGMVFILFALYTLGDKNPVTDFDFETGKLTGVNSIAEFFFTDLTFIFLILGIFVSIRFIHERKFLTLITPLKRINISKILISGGIFGGFLAIGTVIDYIMAPQSYTFSLNTNQFLIGLPIILILTPIQTSAEEFLFRGYLLQSFYRIIKNKYVLAGISGFLFMLPHFANPEMAKSVQEGPLAAVCGALNYFVFGFVFSILTIETNSLEVALGCHAVNNLYCSTIVGFPDSAIQTNTILFTTRFEPVSGFVVLVISSVLYYLIIKKLYGQKTEVGESNESTVG